MNLSAAGTGRSIYIYTYIKQKYFIYFFHPFFRLLSSICLFVVNNPFPFLVCQQKAVKSAAVDRLTDSKRYTGSHKERFDDAGKGKGGEGRKENVDASGYVTGFKKDEVAKK